MTRTPNTRPALPALTLQLTVVFLLILGVALMLGIATPTAHAAVNGIVSDEADVLSAEEEADLTRRLSATSTSLDTQFAVVFIRDVNGQDPAAVASAWYDKHRIGTGDERDGVLFLVATESRHMHLLMNGSPYRLLDRSLVEDTVHEAGRRFAQGYWYEGALIFDKRIGEGLTDERNSLIIGEYSADDLGWPAAGGLLGGVLLLVSGEATARRRLVNMGIATQAYDYIVPQSQALTQQNDTLVDTSISRVPIAVDTSSSSSSGGSWSSSGSSRGGYSSSF